MGIVYKVIVTKVLGYEVWMRMEHITEKKLLITETPQQNKLLRGFCRRRKQ